MPDPRMHVEVSYTFPVGPYASRKIDVWYERDETGDAASMIHALRVKLDKEVEDFENQFKPAADLPTSTTLNVSHAPNVPKTPSVPPGVSTEIPTQPGSLAAYSPEKLSADLDTLQWTQQQSKKGYWIFWDKVPERTRQKLAGLFATEASPRGYVKLDSYQYARSGDEGTFLNRYPIRPVAMEGKQ